MKLIIVDNGNALINADTVTGIEKYRHNLLCDDGAKPEYSLLANTGSGENRKVYCVGTYTSKEICNAAMYELSRFLTSDGDTTFRAFNDEDFMENFPETKILN